MLNPTSRAIHVADVTLHLRGQSLHALATSRSGWTHLALAISFTGASAFSRASHTRGHLNSSALAGVTSLAAARHLTAWRGIVHGMRDRSARRDVIVEIHGNAFGVERQAFGIETRSATRVLDLTWRRAAGALTAAKEKRTVWADIFIGVVCIDCGLELWRRCRQSASLEAAFSRSRMFSAIHFMFRALSRDSSILGLFLPSERASVNRPNCPTVPTKKRADPKTILGSSRSPFYNAHACTFNELRQHGG